LSTVSALETRNSSTSQLAPSQRPKTTNNNKHPKEEGGVLQSINILSDVRDTQGRVSELKSSTGVNPKPDEGVVELKDLKGIKDVNIRAKIWNELCDLRRKTLLHTKERSNAAKENESYLYLRDSHYSHATDVDFPKASMTVELRCSV
jgi:hypothetical protein